MFVVRNTFTARPGQAARLLAHLRDITSGELRSVRFYTDLTGAFNQVIMEHDVESLAEFEAVMQRYASDPRIATKAKGYTEHWITGTREILRSA